MGHRVRAEQREHARVLRADGRTWVEIATALRASWPELNARAAMRVAHGWNQSEAADAWNELWPDRLKTEKDIGLWELRRPGFATLDKLARLYGCSIADLVAGVGDYRHLDAACKPRAQGARSEAVPSLRPWLASRDGREADRAAVTAPDLDGIEAIELTRRIEATDTGPLTLAAIAGGIDRLCRSYTHVAPADLLGHLHAYQGYVGRLLEGRATLAQRKELMRQAGWLALLTATADIDLGYDHAAAANFEAAHGLAGETGDLSLAAWVLETQAWQAVSNGNPAYAAHLCRAGLDIAAPGTSAYVQLCTQLARVSARLGHTHDTYRLVDECVSVVDKMPSPEQDEHHFVCDPRRALSYCGAALVWLGDHGRSGVADEFVRQAVTHYETGANEGRWVHRLAVARLNLALLHARNGQPAEAAHLGGLALESSWRLCRTDLFLAADLDHVLASRYCGNTDVTSFHDHYLNVQHSIDSRSRSGAAATSELT